MKRICDFATGNAHTIVLIYAIVAVIVWVAVNLYFWKISFDLDREIREEMREYGDCYSDTDVFPEFCLVRVRIAISVFSHFFPNFSV